MQTENKPKFIVAEVSKNWPNRDTELLSNEFEEVINVNLSRGYLLKDWKLDRIYVEDSLNETIIAVFELMP